MSCRWAFRCHCIGAVEEICVAVNACDNNGRTALHNVAACNAACSSNHIDILKILISAGAEVDSLDRENRTALHYCCDHEHDRSDVARVLIDAGADIHRRDFVAPLHCHKKWEYKWQTVLHTAAQRGHSQLLTVLLTAGALVDSRDSADETAIIMAARRGHLAAVLVLISAGADVNSMNNFQLSALHSAASGRHSEVVAALLRAGADVNINGSYPLGCTPLHTAAGHGHAVIVRLMLAALRDREGERPHLHHTVLHSAATVGSAEVVGLLLSAGADVHAVDSSGCTALHLSRSTEVTEMLLQAGADVNAVDRYLITALHCAAVRSNEALVRLLLRYGAHVWLQNSAGRTAADLITVIRDSSRYPSQMHLVTLVRQVCQHDHHAHAGCLID